MYQIREKIFAIKNSKFGIKLLYAYNTYNERMYKFAFYAKTSDQIRWSINYLRNTANDSTSMHFINKDNVFANFMDASNVFGSYYHITSSKNNIVLERNIILDILTGGKHYEDTIIVDSY